MLKYFDAVIEQAFECTYSVPRHTHDTLNYAIYRQENHRQKF